MIIDIQDLDINTKVKDVDDDFVLVEWLWHSDLRVIIGVRDYVRSSRDHQIDLNRKTFRESFRMRNVQLLLRVVYPGKANLLTPEFKPERRLKCDTLHVNVIFSNIAKDQMNQLMQRETKKKISLLG